MRDLQLAFTTATTSNASQVIPPGYRPLLATSTADRPLYAAPTRGELSDATPFAIPGTVAEASVASGAATHVEAANPTDGTLTFETKTIVPQGISGLFRVTRELVDSSNPAVDQIAMMAMREDYDRAAEQRVHTELNTVQSGTITNGLVPSGAQARTSTGMALPADLWKALLTFVDVRKRRARRVVASSRTSVSEALEALDMTAFALRDVDVDLSAFITGAAAGDGDVFILADGDVWAWASPLLQDGYYERQGPAVVDLTLFGYFATKVVKPSGVASIRHT